MNHPISVQRKLAAYNAATIREERRKADRERRMAKLREKANRQFLTDKGGWLFAAACFGGAVGIIFLR